MGDEGKLIITKRRITILKEGLNSVLSDLENLEKFDTKKQDTIESIAVDIERQLNAIQTML